MHPLLHLISTQPQLLATHAQAYAELAGAELALAGALWKRRVVLNALALCGLGVAAVLAGVAAMLWAITPTAQIYAPWVLVMAPLWPAALALGCLWAAHRTGDAGEFRSVRRQMAADLALWREVTP